jgi:thiol-disulfide isomerase/thioredoxin
MGTAMLVLRVLLAGVFGLAAVGKLRDLEGSRQAMREFGVPARLAVYAGVLLPLAELAVAVALIPAPTAQWAALAALLLLLGFMAGIAGALRRGEAPDCHCFGQFHSAPAGWDTLARNGVLAVMAAIVVVEGPGPAIGAWVSDRTAAELAAAGAGLAAAVLGVLALQLWLERRRLDDDLTQARRMLATVPAGIPIGTTAPAFSLPDREDRIVTLDALLERGRPILLVFVSSGCGSCVEMLPQLKTWQRTLADRLTIALISSGKSRDNAEVWADIDNVLFQEEWELSEAYRIRATPSAVILTLDGQVASNPAESVFGIEPLVRLALRDGASAQSAEAR